MGRKREIKDGHIVAKNLLYQQLPTDEITIRPTDPSLYG